MFGFWFVGGLSSLMACVTRAQLSSTHNHNVCNAGRGSGVSFALFDEVIFLFL